MYFSNTTKSLMAFALAVTAIISPTNSEAGSNRAVTVTAYNSEVGQTDSTPCQGAHGRVCGRDWGVVAISKDLERHFPPKSKICLEGGISGCFTVMDRMNPRWHRKVDIYVGKSRRAAFNVGHRTAVITNMENSYNNEEIKPRKKYREVRQWLRYDYKSKRNVKRNKKILNRKVR